MYVKQFIKIYVIHSLALTPPYIWIIVGVASGILLCMIMIVLISLCYYCIEKGNNNYERSM